MGKIFHALALSVVGILFSFQSFAGHASYEIQKPLEDLLSFKPGWVTRMVTSHDQKGDNGDGGVVGNPDENGYRVLFHAKGEGRITRIWMTAPKKDQSTDYQELVILIDGNTAYQGPVLDFFSRSPQFSEDWYAPLVMDFEKSSGAFLSYIPFSYQREAKILFKGKSHYYQVSYRQGEGSSKGPSANELGEFLKEPWWEKLLKEPELAFETATVAANQPISLKAPAGWISALAIEVPDKKYSDLQIQIADQPAVPLSFFFGLPSLGKTQEPWHSLQNALQFSNGDKGLFLSRLPIPLYAGEDIKILSTQTGPREIRFKVWKSEKNISHPVRLNAVYKDQLSPGANTTMSFFDSKQATHLVSLVEEISEGNQSDRMYLEGDEMIRTDAMSYPLQLGTGTEDYFNGGWYFLGPHSNPLSGMPRFYVDDPSDGWKNARYGIGMYRHHVSDPVVSRSGLNFGFEAGPTGDYKTARYRSLAMAYAFPGVRLVQKYSVPLSSVRSDNFYEQKFQAINDAEKAQVPVYYKARYGAGRSMFRVACPGLSFDGRAGVLITRGYDAGASGQQALVRVNGRIVGVWFEAYANPHRRFAENILWAELNPNDCANGGIDVEVLSQGSVPWSELGYSVGFYTF